jgi:dipeptide/tripeptide permease
MPRGVPNIIGNEAAERFSFYGMGTILAVFMTTYLMNAAGSPARISHKQTGVVSSLDKLTADHLSTLTRR